LNLLCLHWLFSTFRNGGPAFATVVAGYFNFFVLFAIFRVRYGRLGMSQIVLSVARIGVCAGLMGGMCWMALRWSHFNRYERFLPRLGVFALLIVGATAVYLALAWILRCHEVSEVYGIALHGDHEPAIAPGLPS
jgi:peptidoglycan biosynthesis protein MviN/MurJ (putative lipid II flippase)